MDFSKLAGEGFAGMGEFWPAENQVECRIGVLRIGVNTKIELEVYPNFSGFDSWNNLDSKDNITLSIINGKLRNGQVITLINCLYLLSGGVWRADYLLKEIHTRTKNPIVYGDVNDINFYKARVAFTCLKEWLPRQVSTHWDEENKTMTSQLCQQAPKYEILAKGCKITLNYSWNARPEDSSLEISGHIDFCFNQKKNYKEHIDTAGYFSSFLTLCLDKVVDIEKICLLNDNWDDTVQLIYTKRRDVHEKNTSSNIRIFSYNALEDDFARFISNWYSIGLTEEVRDSLAMFMESYERSVPLEITFLLLVQSWEGIARQIWLSKNGRPGGRTLNEVIKSLFEKVSFVLPDFISNRRDELVDKIVASRNYYIHNSGQYSKSDILDRDGIFIITILMRFMIRIRLLLETGICEDKIKKVLHLDESQRSEPHKLKYLIGQYVYNDLEALCNKLKMDAINDGL